MQARAEREGEEEEEEELPVLNRCQLKSIAGQAKASTRVRMVAQYVNNEHVRAMSGSSGSNNDNDGQRVGLEFARTAPSVRSAPELVASRVSSTPLSGRDNAIMQVTRSRHKMPRHSARPVAVPPMTPRRRHRKHRQHHLQQQQQRQQRQNQHYPHQWQQDDRGGGACREPALPVSLTPALLFVTLAFVWLASLAPAEAIDCFKCASRNGSNRACEDPFHNLNTTRVNSPILPDPQPSVIYHTPCYAGKKNREGLFPASACIKLTGKFDTTGETLVVRHCALDSGTLTQDTELARMSHCGKFQFEGDLLRGCVLACPEDACNSARPLAQLTRTHWLFMLLPLALVFLISRNRELTH